MHKKDYIQRQFEEFGKVLATILTLKKSKDWKEFEKEIEQAALKFTSIELEKIEHLSEEDFKLQVTDSDHLKLLYDQKKILANLLFEKLNSYLERNENEKYVSAKNKCFILYQNLSNDLTHNEFDLEVYYRLELLKA